MISRRAAWTSAPTAGCSASADRRAEHQTTTVTARLRDEQISALFRSVAVGVVAAACASVVLGTTLIRLGYLSWPAGMIWTAAVIGCAAGHLELRRRYLAGGRETRSSARWGYGFAIICWAEGACWGWVSIATLSTSPFGVEMLILVVVLAMAAGSVPTFGAYLPAFFGLFLPATIPFFISNIRSGDMLHEASGLLMLIYILGMGAVGWVYNANFKTLVLLRIDKETLAEKLRVQKELAEQANRAKSQFLASASHDLRQPVHALGLFVGALRGVGMPDEGRRLVEQLDAALIGLDDLFRALLDISRLDAGVVDVRREAFPLQPLLQRVLNDYAPLAAQKLIGLVLHPTSLAAESDPLMVERILRNLVENAVRYTDHGRVVVGCRRGATALQLQVWDTGRGIADHETQSIFLEFHQIRPPGGELRGGLGLGLAIVRRLAQALDSPLTVRSRPGHGSCFSLTLPRSHGEAVQNPPASPPATSPAVLRRGFIVIIDDDDAIQSAMVSLLTTWGHRVLAGASGQAVIDALAELPERPDVIISDYRLAHQETGIAVIRRLRAEYNEDIPAMLITGETRPEQLKEAHRSGFLVLHKPVPNSQLRAAIGNLLRQEAAAAEDN
jgi:signal transduction histidine kinase/CheY-like chemotaxis protein